MASYGIVTGMDQGDGETVTITYELRDDAAEPDLVVLTEQVQFAWILRDGNGDPVAETLAQRRTRLQQQFNARVEAVIAEMGQLSAQFELLRTQAIGYRYPPAA